MLRIFLLFRLTSVQTYQRTSWT